jgi:hypothetical protein
MPARISSLRAFSSEVGTGSRKENASKQKTERTENIRGADRVPRNETSYLLKSRSTPLATSLFQMNSTISAPIVAVMKPAPWSGP